MFKEKAIKVFDVENIKKGGIITFGIMIPDDEGEGEEISKINGIVDYIGEGVIKLTTGEGRKQDIQLNRVLNGNIKLYGYREFV